MNAEAAARLASHKPNQLTNAKKIELLGLLIKSAIQPFNALMLAVAVLSVAHPSSDWETFTLVMVSTIDRSMCLCMTARPFWTGVIPVLSGGSCCSTAHPQQRPACQCLALARPARSERYLASC